MESPYFSVIIPAYNSARYIQESLDSVYRQTFQNYEIIVVNDGSFDETPHILAAQNNPRLRVIHQRNGGECNARNRGVNEALGKYLAFLDSDDIWAPFHLETAYDFFSAHPDVTAFTSPYTDVNSDDLLHVTLPQGNTPCRISNFFSEGYSFVSSSTTIIARDKINTKHLFEESALCNGDRIGWTRYAINAPHIGICPYSTALYRLYPESVSHASTASPVKSFSTWLQIVESWTPLLEGELPSSQNGFRKLVRKEQASAILKRSNMSKELIHFLNKTKNDQGFWISLFIRSYVVSLKFMTFFFWLPVRIMFEIQKKQCAKKLKNQ